MNEEINEVMCEEPAQADVGGYKRVCMRVGLFVIVLFALRIIGGLVISVLPLGELTSSAAFFVQGAISGFCLQILPSFLAVYAFGFVRRDEVRLLYKKPKRLVRAIGNFPAIYGLGITVNILTLTVTKLFAPDKANLAESVNPLNGLRPPDIASAAGLFLMLVIIAPLFEEFIFRGAIQTALEPYGNGVAILVSGISFGLFHGNFSQVFYTTVLGIALAYIRYATGSLVPTIIIHAMVNGMTGFILLFLSTDTIQKYLLSGSTDEIPDNEMLLILLFAIFIITIFALAIVGVILAFIKIKNIRKYKIKKRFTEISGAGKLGIFFSRVTVIVALLMVVDCFAGGFTAGLLKLLLNGG